MDKNVVKGSADASEVLCTNRGRMSQHAEEGAVVSRAIHTAFECTHYTPATEFVPVSAEDNLQALLYRVEWNY